MNRGESSSARQAVDPGTAVHEVLVIDDDPRAIELVEDALDQRLFQVVGATSAQLGLDLIARRRPRVVLLDLVMPGVTDLDLLDRILAIDPGIDVILITGHYSTESAVRAIQKGAYDYLTKPLPVEHLREKLAKWANHAQLFQHSARLDSELLQVFQLEGIVGRSPLMLDVFSKIRRIAAHFQTALVTGDTGTGKESAARALHQLSPYGSGPFVVCNCAAVPEDLFESELFGHVRGAFTGATSDKQGFAEAASGGTLFLDEIGEVPLNVQAKLLRLLQNREVQRLGTSRPKQVDLRIVAATNKDLRTLVESNKLREDLYYRLAVIEVKLPALADRKEDLPLLQRHFVERFAQRYRKPRLSLSHRVQAAFARHTWPGNIRELENVLSYACMVAERETIEIGDLPEYLRAGQADPQDSNDVLMSMHAMELLHLQRVLASVGGNRGRAAAILEISRTTLYRMLAEVQPELAQAKSD